MSTQFKDRVLELENQLRQLEMEARTRIDIALERNMELEREVQDLQYTITLIRRQQQAPPVDTNPPAPHLVEVTDENQEVVKDLVKGLFDFEVLAEAEGFKMEGVDSEGNVLDEDAFNASLEALEQQYPEVYAKLVG